MRRVPTGSSFLDDGLGGGLISGSTFLVEGEEGAGATEFALAVLRAARKVNPETCARFVTVLRTASRVRREAEALFDDPEASKALEIQSIPASAVQASVLAALSELSPGDVIVLESASALFRAVGAGEFLAFVHKLADAASEADVTLLILHTPGTLSPADEHALAETVEGVFFFSWHSGGPTRRRMLTVKKMSGIPPILVGEQVAILEISLLPGTCFAVSRVKSVV